MQYGDGRTARRTDISTMIKVNTVTGTRSRRPIRSTMMGLWEAEEGTIFKS